MLVSRRALAVIALIAILPVVTVTRFALAEQKRESSNDPLAGSWAVTITEGPGTPDLPNWYKALVTFSPGGGLVATITDALLKTGQGAWAEIGKHQFAVTILLFQFDPAGNFLGTLKARATLKVHKVHGKSDTFDSDDYQFEFFDPDGNPTGFVGVGIAHGVRIKAEPLP